MNTSKNRYYRRSRISEKRFRHLIRTFAMDLTVTDAAELTGLLKKLREDADLTQRALGELLGVPQSWVYKCEAAIRRVDVAEFADWAVACGVEPSEAIRQLDGSKRRRNKRKS